MESGCFDPFASNQQSDDPLCEFQQQPSSLLFIPLEQNQPECSISIQFELLNFQKNISSSLEQQQLFGKARTGFITTIAKAIYKAKCYPSREEYECVAAQIILKWNFLSKQLGHVSYVTMSTVFYHD